MVSTHGPDVGSERQAGSAQPQANVIAHRRAVQKLEAQCGLEVWQQPQGGHATTVAQELGGQIDQQLVYEPRLQERAIEGGPGLNMEFIDSAAPQFAHQRSEIDP